MDIVPPAPRRIVVDLEARVDSLAVTQRLEKRTGCGDDRLERCCRRPDGIKARDCAAVGGDAAEWLRQSQPRIVRLRCRRSGRTGNGSVAEEITRSLRSRAIGSVVVINVRSLC